MNAIALTISDVVIRQDKKGRYCLNDLHKAAGGEERHTPNRFTRSESYKSLIDELTPDLAFAPVESIRGGKNPGTYGCKEIITYSGMLNNSIFTDHQTTNSTSATVVAESIC